MKHLKILRYEKGLLQKDVAAFIGVDRTTYVKYENGDSEPSYDILVKLADFFNVSTDYILGRREMHDSDFYRVLLSDKGLKLVRKQLAERIRSYVFKKLQEELNMSMNDLKSFLTLDLTVVTKCDEQINSILAALGTNLYELFEEALINKDVRMYHALDDIDKAEIRGEMKNMLSRER